MSEDAEERWMVDPDVTPPSSSRFAPVAARIPLEPSGKMLESRRAMLPTWLAIQASLQRTRYSERGPV